MIARKHRFHGHHSLNYVYRSGRTERTNYMSLRFASSKNDDYRLAVVVSKKVAKSAVTRNRIRRRIYEIARLHMKDGGKKHAVDLVLTIHDQTVANMPSGQLAGLVEKLLQKAIAQK
jgi:ribonuclease P protein component